jgi:hypothetical protein
MCESRVATENEDPSPWPELEYAHKGLRYFAIWYRAYAREIWPIWQAHPELETEYPAFEDFAVETYFEWKSPEVI